MRRSFIQKVFKRAQYIAPLLLLIFTLIPVHAQTVVETQASDGLTLKGDFYLVDAQRPTVILLHQLYTTRTSWADAVSVLTGAGYNVLAVDIRGYGETGGKVNMMKAVEDIGVWMAWLRNSAGVRGDAISTMGSSMGSALAIVGCANDSACRTAVAVSPGWSYNGGTLEAPLTTQLVGRPIYVVYTRRDRFPALGVPRMLKAAPDGVVTLMFEGNKHGLDMITQYRDGFWAGVLDWLANHGG